MNNDFFGALRIFMYVQPTKETSKKVTLATIHCHYSEARDKYMEFQEMNPTMETFASFIMEEAIR